MKSKKAINPFLELVNCLHECFIITQIEHWKVKGPGSYAAHTALGSFYQFIPDFLDGLVESYQGRTNAILPFNTCSDICCKTDNYLNYIKTKKDMIVANRYYYIPQEYTELHNELDNFLTQMNTLIYKLTNLA
jgi:DNA-binding ferritin-like protein